MVTVRRVSVLYVCGSMETSALSDNDIIKEQQHNNEAPYQAP